MAVCAVHPRLAGAVIAAAVVVLAACGGPSPVNPPPAPATYASPQAAVTSPTASTPPPPPVSTVAAIPGDVVATDTADVTDTGGHKASIAIEWHRQATVDIKGLRATCPDTTEPATGVVFYVVVAKITGSFPPTGGFNWPADHPISLGWEGGMFSSYANHCASGGGATASGVFGTAVDPSGQVALVTWVVPVTKTPNNPQATPSAVTATNGGPAGYTLSVLTTMGETCTGDAFTMTGGNCLASYPG